MGPTLSLPRPACLLCLPRLPQVEYVQGWGKLKSATEVEVSTAAGATSVISTKNIIIATGSEVTPLPGVPVDERQCVPLCLPALTTCSAAVLHAAWPFCRAVACFVLHAGKRASAGVQPTAFPLSAPPLLPLLCAHCYACCTHTFHHPFPHHCGAGRFFKC